MGGTSRSGRAVWAAAILLSGLTACNLPGAATPAATPSPTATARADTLSAPPTGEADPPPTPPRATAAATPHDPTASPSAPPATPVVESVVTTSEQRGAVTLVETTTIARYAVSGATAEEIEASMWASGPTDALGGYRWWALTEPLWDWRTECGCTDEGCTTGPVTAYLSVRYTLPRWAAPEGADEWLRGSWAAFAAALEAHERGHGALAAGCAWSLGEAFAALPPQPTCEAVDAAVRALSGEVFTACRAAQRAYENETNHGRAQGVIWPP